MTPRLFTHECGHGLPAARLAPPGQYFTICLDDDGGGELKYNVQLTEDQHVEVIGSGPLAGLAFDMTQKWDLELSATPEALADNPGAMVAMFALCIDKRLGSTSQADIDRLAGRFLSDAGAAAAWRFGVRMADSKHTAWIERACDYLARHKILPVKPEDLVALADHGVEFHIPSEEFAAKLVESIERLSAKDAQHV